MTETTKSESNTLFIEVSGADLPGGLDQGAEIIVALKRELEQETGARDVKVKEHYGFIEEYRPH